MNLGNKKISFLNFNYFEEERLEEYLNEEADKGWLLKKFNNLYNISLLNKCCAN